MKKLLAIFLTVAMLFSTVALCINVNAADAEMTNALKITSGYFYTNGLRIGTSQTWEFDIWFGTESSTFVIWQDGATNRYTVGADFAGLYNGSSGATAFHGYEALPTGYLTAGHRHVVVEMGVDGKDVITIDGEVVYSAAAASGAYWEEAYILFGEGDIAIDNVSVSGSMGSYGPYDFEDGDRGIFSSDDFTSIISAVWTDPVLEDVTSQAMNLSGYHYTSGLNLGNSQTWEFDLWLADDNAEFSLWADEAYTRYTVAKTFAGVRCCGGESAYGPSDTGYDSFAGIEWPENTTGFLVPNWVHVKMELNVNGRDAIYIDDALVWESDITANSYYETYFIIYPSAFGSETGVAVDNLTITGTETYGPYDFEDGDKGIFDGNIVTVVVEGKGGEVVCPHDVTSDVLAREATCLVPALYEVVCSVCGETVDSYETEVSDHAWSSGHMVDYKAATAEEDGYKVWACTYNCGTTTKATIPATDSYTGDIWTYFDMDEAAATQVIGGFFDAEGLVVENGIGIIPEGNDQSYHQFPEDARDNTQWSVTFDVNVTGIHDTNDVIENKYGHKVYFWFGGEGGLKNEAGYDFDKGCFYIKPASGGSYDAIEYYVDFPMNEWHTIKFEFNAPGEEAFYVDGINTYCAIYVDGEEMVKFSTDIEEWDDTALYELPTSAKFVIIRTFGVNAEVDNYVLGSADFAWVEEETILYGDLNDDGKVNMRDNLLMRQLIIGLVDGNDVNINAADINGDGKINTLDSKAFKAILLGIE